jgi:lysophospholipase L1-like esterase
MLARELLSALIGPPGLLCALVLCGFAAAFPAASLAQDAKPCRVVFFGDSITQAAVGPEGYITQLQAALNARETGRKFELVGAGISGHKVPDLQARLERDVLAKQPDVVVIYIGINDVWHSQSGKGTPSDKYRAGLEDLIAKINAAGARVILCTPSVIGERHDGSNDLDKMLEEYAGISREVAVKTGAFLVDLRNLFLHDLKIRNSENKPSGILTTDGVHLNPAGNELVKDCLERSVIAVASATAIKHVVLFQFKPTATVAEINRVCDLFDQLPGKISEVKSYEAGSDISPEKLAEGLTHCFTLSFADAAARDAYIVHPAHQEFVNQALPLIQRAVVVDYLCH